jgi:beta-glucosidase
LSFRFRLQNTGRRDGAEVAQLYVKRPGEKYWFFVNFEKRFLRAGESVQLELLANRALLRTYDESVEDWVLRRGDYHFMIGSSLSEPRLSRVIRLNSRY